MKDYYYNLLDWIELNINPKLMSVLMLLVVFVAIITIGIVTQH